MITRADIQSKLHGIEGAEAEKLASEINLFAVKYEIDRNQIIDLLDKDPADLATQIIQVQSQRQQTKMDIRKTLLEG